MRQCGAVGTNCHPLTQKRCAGPTGLMNDDIVCFSCPKKPDMHIASLLYTAWWAPLNGGHSVGIWEAADRAPAGMAGGAVVVAVSDGWLGVE
jgi:hypothetical protein